MTLSDIIARYKDDEDSPYKALRYQPRQNAASQLRRLQADHGSVELGDVRARTMKAWYEAWLPSGTYMAHGLISRLRTVIRFGATYLEDPECERIKNVLGGMKFAMGKPRTSRLTVEQVEAIMRTAHAMGYHSIALAQALAFDLILRQRDVIGEWTPLDEPGRAYIRAGNRKWFRGLRFEEINTQLVLKHITSKKQKEIEVPLSLAPLVMQELKDKYVLMSELPTHGPVILNEETGLPYGAAAFRAKWRRVARKAGVPDTVKNMDSRAGGITEATDAGASLELVRHAATHSDVNMTARYSRGSSEKAAEVLKLRAKHRKVG